MIYIISEGRDLDAPIKIGWSHDVKQRLKDLQIGNAKKLCLVATLEGEYGHEQRLHSLLAAHATLSNEWFFATPEIRNIVMFLKSNQRYSAMELCRGIISGRFKHG